LPKQLRQLPAVIAFFGLWATMACGPAQTRVDPEASEKRYLLGADYFNKGLVQPALEELLKAVELNPNNPDAHNLLGLVFLRRGAESEELATRNQCLKGEELRLEKQEGDAHFKKAEAEFEKALQLRPDFSEARNNLAVVAIHFGRYDDAVQLEEKALANIVYRDPFAAQGNLGQAYLLKHDFARAAKALRQAIFEQPKFCVGRYRLAKVYYETREWDRAAEELEQVTADRACPIQEAYHLAGLVALRRDDRDKAKQMFARCVALAPKSCLASECKLAQ
jgi:type IV pilus assembly protein PilF